MNPREYEVLVCEYFSELGYKTTLTLITKSTLFMWSVEISDHQMFKFNIE